MPTPYGTRGGMVFGAEELRVLRRALTLALHARPARAEDLRECLRLAESLDEALYEGARSRAFLEAELARYREALPGTALGYFALLEEALDAGLRPGSDDLAALGALRGTPAAAALLHRCRVLAGQPTGQEAGADGGSRPVRASVPAPSAAPSGAMPYRPATARTAAAVPASRSPLRRVWPAASGGEPAKKPAPKPGQRPAPAQPSPSPAPAPGAPEPARRPIPTPGEVFPRRKPAPPSGDPQQRLAAV
ncbi:hypothetical protein [Streptomyces sp. NPDC004065]|uniref:hypothetical protein n=1 Tax=Streptomyces sp. NPDC004065 TaxID=3364689 RepID=UPI00384A857B